MRRIFVGNTKTIGKETLYGNLTVVGPVQTATQTTLAIDQPIIKLGNASTTQGLLPPADNVGIFAEYPSRNLGLMYNRQANTFACFSTTTNNPLADTYADVTYLPFRAGSLHADAANLGAVVSTSVRTGGLTTTTASLGAATATSLQAARTNASEAQFGTVVATVAGIDILRATDLTVYGRLTASGLGIADDTAFDKLTANVFTAKEGTITTLGSTTASVGALSACTATIGGVTASTVSSQGVNADSLVAATGNVTSLESAAAWAQSLRASDARVTTAAVTHLGAGNLNANTVMIELLSIASSMSATAAYLASLSSANALVANLTATSGYVSNLTAALISAANLTATSATVSNLNANLASTANLTAAFARVGNLQAGSGVVTNLVATYANVDNLLANTASIANLMATFASLEALEVGALTLANLTTTSLTANAAVVANLNAPSATLENLVANVAFVTNLRALFATVGNLTTPWASVSTANIANLTATTATLSNLASTDANIANLVATSATLMNLGAPVGYVGNLYGARSFVTNVVASFSFITALTATTATVGNLNANSATLTNLAVTSATLGNLNANTVTLTNLRATFATLGNLVANSVQATGNSILATATIGNLSANTVTATWANLANLFVTTANIANLVSASAQFSMLRGSNVMATNAQVTTLVANTGTFGTSLTVTGLAGITGHYASYVDAAVFGAKGDGVTDDTQALRNALATGLSVRLRAGSYKVTGTIPFANKDGQRLVGAGPSATIIKPVGTFDVFNMWSPSQPITIAGESVVYYFNRVWGCGITDMGFVGGAVAWDPVAGRPVVTQYHVGNIVTAHSHQDLVFTDLGFKITHNAFSVTDCAGCLIERINTYDSIPGEFMVDFYSYPYRQYNTNTNTATSTWSNGQGLVVRNCTFGIAGGGADGVRLRGPVASIYFERLSMSECRHGLWAQDLGASAFTQFIYATNFEVDNPRGAGLRLEKVLSAYISNFYCHGAREQAIDIWEPCTKIVINAATVTSAGLSTMPNFNPVHNGIDIKGELTVVQGCDISQQYGHGIFVGNTASAVCVTNNHFSLNLGYGLWVAQGAQLVNAGSSVFTKNGLGGIRDDSATAQLSGFNLGGGAATVTSEVAFAGTARTTRLLANTVQVDNAYMQNGSLLLPGTLIAKQILFGEPSFAISDTSPYTGSIMSRLSGPLAAGVIAPSPMSPFANVNAGSIRFSGSTTDTIDLTHLNSFNWYAQDVTMEAWVNVEEYTQKSKNTSHVPLWGCMFAGTEAGYWSFGIDEIGRVAFVYFSDRERPVYTTTKVARNSWNHIAMTFVKAANLIRLFVNGTQATLEGAGVSVNVATIQDVPGVGFPFVMGRYNNRALKGFVADARIVKDHCAYTSSFAPPTTLQTAPTGTTMMALSVRNTSALSEFQLGSTIATSNVTASSVSAGNVTASYATLALTGSPASTVTGGQALVNSGSATLQRSSPYAGISGASIRFTGTGATTWEALPTHLWYGTSATQSTPSIPFSSCMEAWVFQEAYPTQAVGLLWGCRFTNASDGYWGFGVNNTGKLQFNYLNTTSGTQTITTVGTVPLNTWTHIAMSWDTVNIRLFINGVQSSLTGSGANGTVAAVVGVPAAGFPFNIGRFNNEWHRGSFADGRLVQYNAVYTSSFAVPTAPLLAAATGTTSMLVSAATLGLMGLITGDRLVVGPLMANVNTNAFTVNASQGSVVLGTPQSSGALIERRSTALDKHGIGTYSNFGTRVYSGPSSRASLGIALDDSTFIDGVVAIRQGVSTTRANVGINTSAPRAELDVVGNAIVSGWATLANLTCTSATLGNLAANTVALSNLTCTSASLGNLVANTVTLSNLTANTVFLTNLVATTATLGNVTVPIFNSTVGTFISSLNVQGSAGITGHMSGVLDVAVYGAKGDGVTDDTAAIQAALNTGKCVQLRTGTYIVSSTLSFANVSGQKLFGKGKSTTAITFTGTGDVFRMVAPLYQTFGCGIFDMVVGGTSNHRGNAVTADNYQQVVFHNVYFSAMYNGISCTLCNGCDVNGCAFNLFHGKFAIKFFSDYRWPEKLLLPEPGSPWTDAQGLIVRNSAMGGSGKKVDGFILSGPAASCYFVNIGIMECLSGIKLLTDEYGGRPQFIYGSTVELDNPHEYGLYAPNILWLCINNLYCHGAGLTGVYLGPGAVKVAISGGSVTNAGLQNRQLSLDHNVHVEGRVVMISSCDIIGSATDGIHVANTAELVTVTNCNLSWHGRYGVYVAEQARNINVSSCVMDKSLLDTINDKSGQLTSFNVGAPMQVNTESFFKGEVNARRIEANTVHAGNTYLMHGNALVPGTVVAKQVLLGEPVYSLFDSGSFANSILTQLNGPKASGLISASPTSPFANVDAGSIYFNGSLSSTVTVSQLTSFGWSTRDVTMEAWVNYQVYPVYTDALSLWGNMSSVEPAGFWSFGLDNRGQLGFGYFTRRFVNDTFGVGISMRTAASLELNRWYHVAMTYQQSTGTFRFFVNGEKQALTGNTVMASGTEATIRGIPWSGYGFVIGRYNNRATKAFVADARLVGGYCAYTESFTPPQVTGRAPTGTTYFALSAKNTMPLTKLDYSTTGLAISGNITAQNINVNYPTYAVTGSPPNVVGNAYAMIANGALVVSNMTPYASSTAGSLYFTGKGTGAWRPNPPGFFDWYTTPSTMEAWVYQEQYPSFESGSLWGCRATDVSGGYWGFGINKVGKLEFDYFSPAGGDNIESVETIPLNKWTHVATSYDRANVRLFINGVQADITAPGALGVNVDGAPIVSNAANVPVAPYLGGSFYNLTIGKFMGEWHRGYIADARIVTGSALYTSSFQPPTAPLQPAATGTTVVLFSGAFDSNKGVLTSDRLLVGPVDADTNSNAFTVRASGGSVLYSNTQVSSALIERRSTALDKHGLGTYAGFGTRVYGGSTSKASLAIALTDSTFIDGVVVSRQGVSTTRANVGINTPDPQSELHVVGNVTVQGNILASFANVAHSMAAGNLATTFALQANTITASAASVLGNVTVGNLAAAFAVNASAALVLGNATVGNLSATFTARAATVQANAIAASALTVLGNAAVGNLSVAFAANVANLQATSVEISNLRATSLVANASVTASLQVTGNTVANIVAVTYPAYVFVDRGANSTLMLAAGQTALANGAAFPVALSPYTTPRTGSVYFTGTGEGTWAVNGTSLTYMWMLGTSMEAWVNVAEYPASNSGALWGNRDNSGGYWGFGVNNAGRLVFDYFTGQFTAHSVQSSSTIPKNTWTHVAMTFDETFIRLFVNGVQQTLTGSGASGSVATVVNSPATGYPFTLGKVGNEWYRGWVADARIIRGNASTGTSVYTSTFTPPVAPLEPSPTGATVLLLSASLAGMRGLLTSDNAILGPLVANTDANSLVVQGSTGSITYANTQVSGALIERRSAATDKHGLGTFATFGTRVYGGSASKASLGVALSDSLFIDGVVVTRQGVSTTRANVGINTPDPQTDLHVAGNALVTNLSVGTLQVTSAALASLQSTSAVVSTTAYTMIEQAPGAWYSMVAFMPPNANGMIVTRSLSPFSGSATGSLFFNSAAVSSSWFPSPNYFGSTEWYSNAITMEAWVNVSSYPAYGLGAVHKGLIWGSRSTATPDGNWGFGVDDTGKLAFSYNTLTNGTQYVATSASVALNTWTHVAMTCDASKVLRMFINGQQAALTGSGASGTTASIVGVPTAASSFFFAIGRYYGITYSGFLADARIIRGAALYTASFTQPTAPRTSVGAGTAVVWISVVAAGQQTALLTPELLSAGPLQANAISNSFTVTANTGGLSFFNTGVSSALIERRSAPNDRFGLSTHSGFGTRLYAGSGTRTAVGLALTDTTFIDGIVVLQQGTSSRANVGINTSTPAADLHVTGNVIITPAATPPTLTNGEVSFALLNNTTLQFWARGSDGVLRSGSVTLS